MNRPKRHLTAGRALLDGLIMILCSLALVCLFMYGPRWFGFYVDLTVIAHEYSCDVSVGYLAPPGGLPVLSRRAPTPADLTCPPVPNGAYEQARHYGYTVVFVSKDSGAFYRLELGLSGEFNRYPIGGEFHVTGDSRSINWQSIKPY